MSSPLREWDVVWVKQKCRIWWPAVISSAPCEPSKGMWQTRVGEMNMFHCTFLDMDHKTEWVEEVYVKRWEVGIEMDHAKDFKDVKKSHQEAINLGLKILTDPEKEEVDDADQNAQRIVELSMDEVKPDADVNQPEVIGRLETAKVVETTLKIELERALKGKVNNTDSMVGRVLFVKGFSVQATEGVLAEYFGSFGEVEDVGRRKMLDCKGLSKSRNHCAQILFKDSSSVEKAIILRPHKILGQFVVVEKDKKGRMLSKSLEHKKRKQKSHYSGNKGKRKFGIDKGSNFVSFNNLEPPVDEPQSKYRYPHCPAPKSSSGFEDDH